MQTHYAYSTMDYLALPREELRRAHDEWDRYGTGPRALFEQRNAREREFRQMVAPGGTLSDLAVAFARVTDAHAADSLSR